jgi:hypothetical protein
MVVSEPGTGALSAFRQSLGFTIRDVMGPSQARSSCLVRASSADCSPVINPLLFAQVTMSPAEKLFQGAQSFDSRRFRPNWVTAPWSFQWWEFPAEPCSQRCQSPDRLDGLEAFQMGVLVSLDESRTDIPSGLCGHTGSSRAHFTGSRLSYAWRAPCVDACCSAPTGVFWPAVVMIDEALALSVYRYLVLTRIYKSNHPVTL